MTKRYRHVAAILGTCALAIGLVAATPAPVGSGGPAPDAAEVRVDYDPVVAQLRTEIPLMMAEEGIVGATVALVDGHRTILARGFGWADRDRQRAVDARTLFHIGSLSKTFAAISVMQLVERGKVDLDAPITRYVPDLQLIPRFRNNTITVRSILDHHSGVPGDIFYGLITMKKPDRHFRSWLMKTLRTMPPERRVDTTWAYNNSGYVLLQALVENVTGEPYADRTARTLFGRMDMSRSSFDDTQAPDRAMTRNYSPALGPDGQPTGTMKADPREYVNGWTAGSILSSARDMTRYLKMLVSDGAGVERRVVKPRTLHRMTTAQTHLAIDGPVRIGLSWFLWDSWMGRTFGHDGATTRNFSMLSVHPRQELGVFVSTNTVGGSAVADAIAARALELAYTAKTGIPKPPPVTLPDPGPATPTTAELRRAEGTYGGYTGYSTVAAQGNDLELAVVNGGEVRTATFTRMSDGWWRTDADPNLQMTFRTIAGRRVLLTRNGGGSRAVPRILGRKLRAQSPPRRWQAAAGHYRARLDPTHATDLVPKDLRLRVSAERSMLELGPSDSPEVQFLHPIESDHAFTFGLSASGGRRKGDIVWLDGRRIVYMGVTYRRR